MKNTNHSRQKKTYDLEALEELIDSILEASGRGAAIIVEGRRDEKALRRLGASGPVILASRRPALDLAEEAGGSYQEIIVLTDWDGKGDEMAKLLEKFLRHTPAVADLEIRSRLKKLVKKEIKDVESLAVYAERMRELYGEKNCSNGIARSRKIHPGG
jgi:5S rRNA maturation endonuclease (ribonuclease M5)